jgi:hypothetical protein
MKTLSTILLAFLLIALCVGECIAQSTSSATQTITFGVRRITAPSVAANFSLVRSDNESPAMNPMPQKVTIGSDVLSEDLFVVSRVSSAKKVRQEQLTGSSVAMAESQSPLRSAPPKSVITVTE